MIDPTMKSLVAAILEGDGEAAISHAERLRESGVGSRDIVVHGVEAAMAKLDEKCTLEQFNLLEIMLAGRAVTEVMKVLQPAGEATMDTKGAVVDSDPGRAMFTISAKTFLKWSSVGKGYARFAKEVKVRAAETASSKPTNTTEKERPLAIGISGSDHPGHVAGKTGEAAVGPSRVLGVKVIAGGAALKQSSTGNLNVDFVAETAFDILRFLEQT